MILYADEINLFLADKDHDSLISKANSELHKVSNWFRANILQLNISKTKCMLYNVKVAVTSNNIELKLYNERIRQVDSLNFLGLIIDQKLSWPEHIQYISRKIGMYIGIMWAFPR